MNEGEVTTKSTPRMSRLHIAFFFVSFESEEKWARNPKTKTILSLKRSPCFKIKDEFIIFLRWQMKKKKCIKRRKCFEYKHIIMINYVHTFNRLCCIFRLSHLSDCHACLSISLHSFSPSSFHSPSRYGFSKHIFTLEWI